MRKREEAEYPVAVFDIGGTWFRSAVLMPGRRLVHVHKRPAINYVLFADPPQILQSRLVEFILSEVRSLGGAIGHPLSSAAISLGAALNARTGLILNSGPLWGPNCLEFDLLAVLRQADTTISWQLFNDITASLLYHSTLSEFEPYAKIALITVSTGIGMRTYDKSGPRIPTDSDHGIQGEIGHIPIHFQFCGKRWELDCDCGGKNHLNAFCSGRGIGRILEQSVGTLLPHHDFPWLHDLELACSEEQRNMIFADATARGEPFALEMLHYFTRPLAEALICIFTIDPSIERIIFTGGVVDNLGKIYMQSLLKNAIDIGLYQITNRDPSYFLRRVGMGRTDEQAGLIGAGLFTDRTN